MNQAPAVRYAGFWKRSNAYGYDLIICQLMTLVPMFLFYHFPSLEEIVQTFSLGQWGERYTQFWAVISLAYNTFYIAGPKMATPGKTFCDCYVVNADGSRLSLPQSALRHVMCAIGTFTWGLGFLTVAFTHEKLGPHDMICHTRVLVKEKPPKRKKEKKS